MRVFVCLALSVLVAIVISGCDQLHGTNRYEVLVDKNGRTIRLDRKTGEIAIIEGNTIVSAMGATEAENTRKAEALKLAVAKRYPRVVVEHLYMEADLSTSWQDGKVYYDVRFNPLGSESVEQGKAKGDTKTQNASNLPAFKKEMLRYQFSLLLEDQPFELLRQQLSLTYHADERGDIKGYGARGNVPMSQEMYKRIDAWNINWQQNFR